MLTSISAVAGSAAVTSNQVYSPYGAQRYRKGTVPTDKGFTGQYLDASGLNYDHARYYDAVVGRFVSADITQGNAQGMDPYSYVGNNPETRNDPTGQRFCDPTGKQCEPQPCSGNCSPGGGNGGGGNPPTDGPPVPTHPLKKITFDKPRDIAAQTAFKFFGAALALGTASGVLLYLLSYLERIKAIPFVDNLFGISVLATLIIHLTALASLLLAAGMEGAFISGIYFGEATTSDKDFAHGWFTGILLIDQALSTSKTIFGKIAKFWDAFPFSTVFDGVLNQLGELFPALKPYVRYINGGHLGLVIADYVSDDVYTSWVQQASQDQLSAWPI